MPKPEEPPDPFAILDTLPEGWRVPEAERGAELGLSPEDEAALEAMLDEEVAAAEARRREMEAQAERLRARQGRKHAHSESDAGQ
jgi:hypothetical protein